ncbi:hypothetical protein [Zymobacter palmae]|uniref:hypothetical protein n=1 Tax=Zymobacter palmae TaxID=33074 RepID=UPI00048701FD|nr:hypothetical protein [Zymobacter palmae]
MTDEQKIELLRQRFGKVIPEFSSNALSQIIEWAVSELAADQLARHVPEVMPDGIDKMKLTASISVEIGELEFTKGIPPVRCFLSFDCGDNWAGTSKESLISDSNKRYLAFKKRGNAQEERHNG